MPTRPGSDPVRDGCDPERGAYAAVIGALAVGMILLIGWLVWSGCEWCWMEFVEGVG